MFLELHLLQNFAPSCLNRDDTNTPKDCVFGGHRRARISSQCMKRAIRNHFKNARLLEEAHLAIRTKRVISEVCQLLADRGRDVTEAAGRVTQALAAVKLASEDKNETQYLLFLGRQELTALAEAVDHHWDVLVPTARAEEPEPETASPKKVSKKKEKAEKKEAVPSDVSKRVNDLFNGGKAADLALFGRMLADHPSLNVDAACQVAHALSTNRVTMEMDFYTAVDDLKERDTETGAGMMGTVEFNSSCYYRYSNLDFHQLESNLHGDRELTRRTVQAFIEASLNAIPTGKQNSMAAHNPPSLVLAVVRQHGLWSLANAFEKPVWPSPQTGLVAESANKLDTYWGDLTRMYGKGGILGSWVVLLHKEVEMKYLSDSRLQTVGALLDEVLKALPGGKETP